VNIKDARKLKPGAIVREAWLPDNKAQGIVLSKEHYTGEHMAKCLSQKKKERYDVKIYWIGDRVPQQRWADTKPKRVQIRENWELMVISHAPS